MNRYILFITLLFIGMHCYSQERIIRQRLRYIDFWHWQLGGEFSVNENYYFAPTISVGIGSCRNWFGIDTGISYQMVYPAKSNHSDNISVQQLRMYVSAELHPMRWRGGCILMGGQIGYNLPVLSRYWHEKNSLSDSDGKIGYVHATTILFIGIIISRCKLTLHHDFDVSPAFNQKYLFESPNYEFKEVRDKIYERHRIGLSFTYLFNI